MESICSLDSVLFFIPLCSTKIPNDLEVITKMSFFKNPKMLNPVLTWPDAKENEVNTIVVHFFDGSL